MANKMDPRREFNEMPDRPSDQEWDRWLLRNSKIDESNEETLVRYPDLPGNCGSCNWWGSYAIHKDLNIIEDGRVYMEGGLSGRCFRFPPNVVDEGSNVAEFPTTDSSMGCGEWQLRKGSDLANPEKSVNRDHVRINNLPSRGYRHGTRNPLTN